MARRPFVELASRGAGGAGGAPRRTTRRGARSPAQACYAAAAFASSFAASCRAGGHDVLQVPLLDRQLHLDELAHARMPGLLVQLLEDAPVPDLAGLGHGQELEAVQVVGAALEVGLHHRRALGLDGACLGEDLALLAVDARGDGGAVLLGLRGLLAHRLQLLAQLRVLGQLLHALGCRLRGHREADHLAELRLQVRQFRHAAPFRLGAGLDAVRESRRQGLG